MLTSSLLHNCTWLGICLLAYCAQPLLVDLIKYNGGAHASTFLFLMPHYFSMVLVGFYPTDAKLSDRNWRVGISLSVLDIANQLLKKGGLVFAGAAAYIVVDSSTIVWTAMWSRLILHTKLTPLQWTGLGTIAAGIAIKAKAMTISFEDDECYGVALILISSILMGLTYVLNERFMQAENPICGPTLVFMMGVCCSGFMSVWTIIWTIPRRNELIIDKIAASNGHVPTVLLAFLGLFLAGIAHSGTFWYILSTYGAVSSGVLKGAKVAIVFLLSHFFFCKYQASQCLNKTTSLSCIVSVAGVCLYSYATAQVVDREAAPTDKRDAWRWLTGRLFEDEESGSKSGSGKLSELSKVRSSLTSMPVCGGVGRKRTSTGDVYKLTPGLDKPEETLFPSKRK